MKPARQNTYYLTGVLLTFFAVFTMAGANGFVYTDLSGILSPPDSTRKASEKHSDRYGDEFSNPGTKSPLFLDKPSNVETTVELDSSMRTYSVYEKVGDMDYRIPTQMTFQEFAEYQRKKMVGEYWQTKVDSSLKRKEDEMKPPIFEIKRGGEPLVEIRPSGFVSLDFGAKWQRTDNPAIPIRLQRIGGFDFDQQISMNLVGKIGDRLKINANWDTKATFDFDNQIRIAYEGKDTDILKELQAGNVSMPLRNSLVRGAQNLFGVKTTMQFGRLQVTALASTQRGKTESIVIRGGAQGRQFEMQATDYESNKHFFLAHFFRNNFERAYRNNPTSPNMGYKITRVEAYVTNTRTETRGLRNIVGLIDLGENAIIHNRNLVTPGTLTNPDNSTNNLLTQVRQNPDYRNSDQTISVLQALNMELGRDFERVTSSRKLEPERDFTFHPDLGFISLNFRLRDDEAISVAYEYTYNGRSYKVGELTEDYQNFREEEVILLKLIKPQSLDIELETWDLMMKNVYSLNTTGLKRDNFQLRVVYKDDLTGVDNPSLQEGRGIKDVPLLQIFKMDTLNQNGDFAPDGNFDFIEGATVNTQYGKILFPVLEPFGGHLERTFKQRDPENQFFLSNKYVFNNLYDQTQNVAKQQTAKNKFFITGMFESLSSADIMLPGIGIQENSVVITSGSITLTPGTDYTVDYQMGRVKIINTGVMASGKDIVISFEKSDMFNFRQKSLIGTRLDYTFNEEFTIGGTLLQLNERPMITRVNIGDEPVKNTQIGLDLHYKEESRTLTKLIDKIPLIATKEKSFVSLDWEGAMLHPGSNRLIGPGGNSYIDDFEGARTPYDFTRQPNLWMISSTPRRIEPTDQDYEDWRRNDLGYAYHRGKVSLYTVDLSFYQGGGGAGNMYSLREGEDQNHYTRSILPTEIFPERQQGQFVINQSILDMAYYPAERGPYNYNDNIDEFNPDGTFREPEKNWGGVTKAVSFDTDFQNANIEYIEFWLMDPFHNDGQELAQVMPDYADVLQNPNTRLGGELYFNLGDISEDVVKDGRHGFENGLPENVIETEWGKVTTEQFLNRAFDAQVDRTQQDVGLDGVNNNEEREFFGDVINTFQGYFTADAINKLQQDPSSDDFEFYILGDTDTRPLLERYKNFSGLENNSPINQGNANFTPASKTVPDNEDLNDDKTLNLNDRYYQYRMELNPQSLNERVNPYIVGKQNTQGVDWYQVRIPIRQGQNIGGISGFQTIKFFRMFLTGFEHPVVLRMAQLQLVASQWRKYTAPLGSPDLQIDNERSSRDFILSTVNIEENSAGTDVSSPYVIPPGTIRDFDQTSNVPRQLNEQSLSLCVTDLPAGEDRAAFKNMMIDLLSYKKLKMFIHAETADPANTLDGQVKAFMRVGTDLEFNYYEIEIPLTLSDVGSAVDTEVWRIENEFDVPIQELINTKNMRNSENYSKQATYSRQFGKYVFSVKGNPDISAVMTAMLGVRNPIENGTRKTACVWFNEMRVSEFDQKTGYATTGTLAMQLADLGTFTATMRYTTVGYGDIERRVSERERQNTLEYGFATNLALEKFVPEKVGLQLPLYASYDKQRIAPNYNPLDPDVELRDAIGSIADLQEREEFRRKVIYDRTIKSVNLTNVKKNKTNPEAKNHIYDIENITLSAGYSEETRGGLGGDQGMIGNSLESYVAENYNGSIGYAYTAKPFAITPFKKAKFMDGKYLKLIKELNFNPVPSSVSLRGDIDRRYIRTQLYNDQLTTFGVSPTFEKYFTFNRAYNLRWSITKSININYMANANAIVDEPMGDRFGTQNMASQFYAATRQEYVDSVNANLRRLGRLKNYNQTVNVTYTLPIDKIPITDWINADLSYKAGFSWTAAALGLTDTLGTPMGNLANNDRDISINGKLNLLKLYNKVKFLKEINSPKPPPRPGARPPVKPGQEANKEEEEKPPREFKAFKQMLKTLMMVQNVNGRYSVTHTTALPGFLPIPRFLGFDDFNDYAPGYLFLMGDQELDRTKQNAVENNWLTQSPAQNNAIMQTRTEQYNIRTTIEPFKDFRVQVDAKYNDMRSYSEIFRVDPETGEYATVNPVVTGNLNMSYIFINTAFTNDVDRNISPVFRRFEQNRDVVKGRLEEGVENKIGNYDRNSQDVLIPSFLAAYSGRDVNTTDLSSAPRFPLPNWRVDYAGLSKMKALRKKFSSFNITHGYIGMYDVAGYTSSLRYDDFNYRESIQRNSIDLDTNSAGLYQSVFIVQGIRISEKFSPLIGVNMRTRSKLNIRIDYNWSRDVALDMANTQVTEMVSSDIVFGFGFTRKNLSLKFLKDREGNPVRFKNDMMFKIDMAVRDTRTVQRALDGNNVITAGNLNFQLRPNINYEVNKRLNVQLYFERTINEPKISSSFRRTTTAFGIRVRFNLA